MTLKVFLKRLLIPGLSLLLLANCSSFTQTKTQACEKPLKAPQQVLASSWSSDLQQSRFRNAEQAGMTGEDLPKLVVQWSFVFDDAVHPRSVPAITDQAIIIGSEEGAVLALDRQSGCAYWRYQAEDEVRTGITLATVAGRQQVFFGDLNGSAYAIDALTGAQIWKRNMDEHPHTMITGTPIVYGEVLYVPLSSFEAAHAMNPFYSCCTFRGGVHAVDATSGETLWKTHTIEELPKKTGRNAVLVTRYAPSGAPVWSAPTIDEARGVLYVGSGQNYSSPAQGSSDAIMAMDLKTGAIKWKHQLHSDDAWNVACGVSLLKTNCPEEDGPDFDFGAPPMLITNSEGRQLLIAGQKSGMVYALDPDRNGELLWSRKVGRGGILGGVHWGLAAAGDAIYVPISDADLLDRVFPGEPNPSISKLDLNTGEIIWQTKVNFDCEGVKGCRNGLSAAVTLIEGAVIAPGLDGVIHAYDSVTGKEIWQYNTRGEFQGVNGSSGHGGTLDAGGAVVADGQLIINSGYGGIISAGGMAGNVLLVFGLAE